MTPRPQNKQLTGKIPFVYYHPTWQPSLNAPIWKLRSSGKLISIDQYEPDLGDKKRYFCPRCGYPCYRSPKYKPFDKSNRSARFCHHPLENHPPCNLRTDQAEGKRYVNQQSRSQAVESGCLTIISQWRSRPNEEELNGKEASVYSKTVESDEGEIASRPINRHIGSHQQIPRAITSLDFIAKHIDEFLGQDIQLPSFNSPEPFLDVFIHASQIDSSIAHNGEALYWGLVERVSFVNNYLCISFGYLNHCVYFGIPMQYASDRGWSLNNLKGRYIIIAGCLEKAKKCQAVENTKPVPRSCWQVIASDWGAVGIISESLVSILPLPHPTTMQWLEPPPIQSTEKSNPKVREQELPPPPQIHLVQKSKSLELPIPPCPPATSEQSKKQLEASLINASSNQQALPQPPQNQPIKSRNTETPKLPPQSQSFRDATKLAPKLDSFPTTMPDVQFSSINAIERENQFSTPRGKNKRRKSRSGFLRKMRQNFIFVLDGLNQIVSWIRSLVRL
ncbi:hypothetical protein HC931_27785 [Candidatus Gracilibacteria bacterium]|nr:hypothetical protein [Candidatus Gracilibacteria bacterium]NJM90266.1 hypothetical protein [Hydrococcus sp. RU_2_2]NJP22125.1 hypothetical protein [Hydrococcus sp. CRU_1_1]NJQ98196.1 hypothetical protein [Hydrococcus sp. CSU_1_8]